MKRHLILSSQQLISLLERLGYEPVLEEEVHYRCGADHTCEPFLSYTMHVQLPDQFALPSLVIFSVPKKESLFT